MNPHIQRAIAYFGGQEAMAEAVGVSQPAVSKWLRGGGIDIHRAVSIELITEGVVKAADILLAARPETPQEIIELVRAPVRTPAQY